METFLLHSSPTKPPPASASPHPSPSRAPQSRYIPSSNLPRSKPARAPSETRRGAPLAASGPAAASPSPGARGARGRSRSRSASIQSSGSSVAGRGAPGPARTKELTVDNYDEWDSDTPKLVRRHRSAPSVRTSDDVSLNKSPAYNKFHQMLNRDDDNVHTPPRKAKARKAKAVKCSPDPLDSLGEATDDGDDEYERVAPRSHLEERTNGSRSRKAASPKVTAPSKGRGKAAERTSRSKPKSRKLEGRSHPTVHSVSSSLSSLSTADADADSGVATPRAGPSSITQHRAQPPSPLDSKLPRGLAARPRPGPAPKPPPFDFDSLLSPGTHRRIREETGRKFAMLEAEEAAEEERERHRLAEEAAAEERERYRLAEEEWLQREELRREEAVEPSFARNRARSEDTPRPMPLHDVAEAGVERSPTKPGGVDVPLAAPMTDKERSDQKYCDQFRDVNNPCRYCQQPLPKNPSPELDAMRGKLAGRSGPPGPLARQYCTLHRAETDILPLGWRDNYPRELDFDTLDGRLEESFVRTRLRRVIADPDLSKLFRTVAKQIEAEGAAGFQRHAVQEVAASNATPGYYGPLGQRIVMKHFQQLLHWGLLPSLTTTAIAPLSAADFLLFVLVPEAITLLIMADQGWRSSRCRGPEWKAARERAMVVRTNSATYGAWAFPSDSERGRALLHRLTTPARVDAKRARLEQLERLVAGDALATEEDRRMPRGGGATELVSGNSDAGRDATDYGSSDGGDAGFWDEAFAAEESMGQELEGATRMGAGATGDATPRASLPRAQSQTQVARSQLGVRSWRRRVSNSSAAYDDGWSAEMDAEVLRDVRW